MYPLSHLILIVFVLCFAVLFPPHIHPWSPILQVVLLFWGVFLWFYHGVKKGVWEVNKYALPLPLLVFLGIALFYTFYSLDHATSRGFFFYLLSYVLVYFLVAELPFSLRGRLIPLVIVILGVVTSCYGIYQHLWGFEGLLAKIEEAGIPYPSPLKEEVIERLKGGRIFSTFLLPSHFAAFLGVSTPLCVALGAASRRWVRYALGLATGVQLFALYLTHSFSGWVSLLSAIVVFSFVYLGYQKKKGRNLIAVSAGVIIALVLVFVLFSLRRADNPFSALPHNPLLLRVVNWWAAVRMIVDSPWLGRGLETFAFVYPSYQFLGANVVHHAHNTYLQLGVEIGVLGVMAFLWFALWWFWRTTKSLQATRDKGSRSLIGGAMVAGVAFFFHHAMDFEFYLPSVTLAGFACLALSTAQLKGEVPYRIRVKKEKGERVIILGLLFTIALSVIFLFPFYGELQYREAKRLLDEPRFPPEWGAERLKKAIRFDPLNSLYHHHYGVVLFWRLAQHEEGVAEVKKAIRLSPWRHYYHFDLGMIYLALGKEEEGVEALKEAVRLYPLNLDYHRQLRAVYLKRGEGYLAGEEEACIRRIQGERVD